MAYDLQSGRKWMTVADLKRALSVLDDDMLVECNRVSNLAVYNADFSQLIGLVDFHWLVIEFFDNRSYTYNFQAEPIKVYDKEG